MECMLNRRIIQESGGGDTSETWVLNERVIINTGLSVAIDFISNKSSFTLFHFVNENLKYDNTKASLTPEIGESTIAMNALYRKLTFATAPTGDLLTWLQTNGIKQEKNLAILPSRTLTITSNGTTTITPYVPYDAVGQVDLTVNVASSGGETTQLNVTASGGDIEAPLFCVWQTSDGWTGTATFDTSTSFTVPNVIVGGYVIFTHDPMASLYFSTSHKNGIEVFDVGAMDAEGDITDAALVIKVTAPSPSFIIRLING